MAWETVHEKDYEHNVNRFPVPGGWIYVTVGRIVFVPEPNKVAAGFGDVFHRGWEAGLKAADAAEKADKVTAEHGGTVMTYEEATKRARDYHKISDEHQEHLLNRYYEHGLNAGRKEGWMQAMAAGNERIKDALEYIANVREANQYGGFPTWCLDAMERTLKGEPHPQRYIDGGY